MKIECTAEEAGPSTVRPKGATVSAFDVLMSPVKVPPPKKTSRYVFNQLNLYFINLIEFLFH